MFSYIERMRHKRGFTLVELLVVIVVLAVLAAIVLPKFMNSSSRSKESALKSDLKLARNAISLFQTDTGVYPKSLADLSATSADGVTATITASDWHGPYLESIPTDPVSGNALNYDSTTGKVTSSATGNALDGTAYSSW